MFHVEGSNSIARQVTTSDADGRFTLHLPTGKRCVVLAKSSRLLGAGNFEHYYWISEVSDDIKGDLILSSPNQLNSQEMVKLLQECGADTRALPLKLIHSELGAPNLSWRHNWRDAFKELSQAEQKKESLQSKIDYTESTVERLQSEEM